MKTIVFVPVFPPGMPCASWPSLFPYECAHTAFVLGFAIRWQYSSSSLLSPITKLAILQSHFMGDFCCHSWDGEILRVGLVMSMHDSIASCMMLCDLMAHLLGVGLSSLSW
jgi:hypothetical protein